MIAVKASWRRAPLTIAQVSVAFAKLGLAGAVAVDAVLVGSAPAGTEERPFTKAHAYMTACSAIR